MVNPPAQPLSACQLAINRLKKENARLKLESLSFEHQMAHYRGQKVALVAADKLRKHCPRNNLDVNDFKAAMAYIAKISSVGDEWDEANMRACINKCLSEGMQMKDVPGLATLPANFISIRGQLDQTHADFTRLRQQYRDTYGQ